jgi:hypothetical protein
MSSNKNSVINVLAFVALMIIAVLEILSGLSHLGIDILGVTILAILSTVKNFCVILVIGVAAYDYISNKKHGYKIAFLIAVIVFLLGTVFAWF